MATNGGRIEFQVGLNVDTKSLDSLKKSLQDIQKIKPANFAGSRQELEQIKKTASDVEVALRKAFNANIGSLNVSKLNNELFKTTGDINNIYNQFSKLGPQGEAAFAEVARGALTTNLQLKETRSIISEMGTTLINTLKWNISSSAINGFAQGIQSAFSYVKSLDAALTDIRIVTGDSQQKMQQFAQSANKAAQSLGRSTMDYTKSALTFYQQGLDEESVQARTEAVLKAQNITGAGAEMADYMTAVWNGYKVANEQAELYIDKLAAVADSSASDMSQLAIAMSRVASTANNMGVSVDQLNAQIATVVATTRQAPEAVGTAFKTIYTRLNDVKTGADGAEISLGNYSKKMAEVGFNVLDTNGRLRDTGQIMEEIGSRWGTLTKEQQIYLASTMGGQRQVNYLMSLFQNWTTYSDLLNTSLESQGTLSEKNARYMESLGAKMQQLATAQEHVKAAMVETDSWKAVLQILTAIVDTFGTFIDSIGGGGVALTAFGSVLTQLFSGVISKELEKVIINMQAVKNNAKEMAADIALTEKFGRSQGYADGAIQEMVKAKQAIQQYYSVMSEGEINSYTQIVNNIGALETQQKKLSDNVKEVEKFDEALRKAGTDVRGIESLNSQLRESFSNMPAIKLNDLNPTKEALLEVESSVRLLQRSMGESAPAAINNFLNGIQKIKEDGVVTETVLHNLRGALKEVVQQTGIKIDLSLNLDNTKQDLSQVIEKLDLAKKGAEKVQNAMAQRHGIEVWTQSIAIFGRVSSSLMSISNIFSILTNDSLSGGQKFLQIATTLSFATGSLVSAYMTLNKLIPKTTAQLGAEAAVKTAKIALDKAENTLKERKILLLLLQKKANGSITEAERAILAAIEKKLGVMSAQTAALYVKDAAKKQEIATEKLSIATKDAETAASRRLFDTLKAHPYYLVAAAITAAIAIAAIAYQKLTVTVEQAKEKIKKSSQAYETEKEKLDSLQNKLKETTDRIKELQAQDSLTIVEDEELVKLHAINQELKEQIKNQEEIADQKQKQIALDTYTKNFKTTDANGGYGEKAPVALNNQIQDYNVKDDIPTYNEKINQWLKTTENVDNVLDISNIEKLQKVRDDLTKVTADQFGITEDAFKDFSKHINDLVKESENFYKGSYQEILKDYHIFQEGLANPEASQSEKAMFQQGLQQTKELLDNYYSYVSDRGKSIAASVLTNSTKINENTFNQIKEELKEKDFTKITEEKIQDILKKNLSSTDLKNLNAELDQMGMSAKTLLKILSDPDLTFDKLINIAKAEKAKIALESLQDAVNLLSKQQQGTKLTKKELQQLKIQLKAIGGEYEKLNGAIEVLSNTALSGTELYRHSLQLVREELIKQNILSGNLAKAQENIFSLKDLQVYRKTLKENFKESYKQQKLTPYLQKEIDRESDSDNKHVKYDEKNKTYIYDEEYYKNYINSLEKSADKIYENSNYQQEQNKILMELAAQYNNCTLEILNYDNALNALNNESVITDQNLRKKAETLKTNSEFSLQAAIRANQLAGRYKLEKDQVVDLTRTYIELAKEKNNGVLTEGIALSAASDAAGFIQQNRGITNLKDNYYDLLPVLEKVKKATDETFNETMKDIKTGNLKKQLKQLKSVLADIAHVTEDQIDDKWLKTYAEDLEKIATNNDEQALARVQQGMQLTVGLQDMGITVNMDQFSAALDTAYDSVAEWAASLPEGELGLNQVAVINQLVALMQEAGMTVGEIQDFFSQAHIRLNFSDTKEGMQYLSQEAAQTAGNIAKAFTFRTKRETLTDKATDYAEAPTGYTAQLVPVEGDYSIFGGVIPSEDGTTMTQAPPIEGTTRTWSLHFTSDPKPEAQENETAQTAFGQTVESAFNEAPKPPSGGISESNKQRNLGGGKGGKGGGKGGKGGKQQKPDRVKLTEKNKETRYHGANKKIASLGKDFEKLEKQKGKAYGSGVKKVLEEELEVLEKQIEAEKEKIKLEEQEREEIRDRLKDVNAHFDEETHELLNYEEIYDEIENQIIEKEKERQQMTKQQQDETKDSFEEFKEARQKELKDLERYVQLWKRSEDSLEKIFEDQQKQFEKRIEHFKIEIDLHLNFEQLEREWQDFEDKVINQLRDDDIFGNIESKFKNIYTYFEPTEGADNSIIQHLTDQVSKTMDQIKQIQSTGTSDIYGSNIQKALQDLNNYNKQLQDGLKNYISLLNEVKQKYYDLTNVAQEAFDMQEKRYSSLGSWLEHDKKLLELVYGEKAYDKTSAYDEKIRQNNNAQIAFHKQQKDFWWARMQEEKARMETLEKDSLAYKEAEDRYKEGEKHWLEAANSFSSTIEKAVQSVTDAYNKTIEKILDDLDKKLTGGKGLQKLKEEWQLATDIQDDYLDNVDKIYQTEKLENAVRQALKENQDNPKAQKALNKFLQDEVGLLKEKDKLTQYDIDHANKALEIEQKRIALQESRNSKTKLRLKRDAAGNYSYQFVADETESENKLQELKDLKHQLYTIDKEKLKEITSQAQSVISAFKEGLGKLYSQGASQEQIDKYFNNYQTKMEQLRDQEQTIRQNTIKDMWDSVGDTGQIDGVTKAVFDEMSESEQDEFLGKVVPGWKNGITEMMDAIAAEGGLAPVCQDAMSQLGQATADYKAQLAQVQQQAGVSFEQLGQGIDDTAEKTQELITENEGLISTYEEAFTKMGDYIDQVGDLADEYDDMMQAAIQAAEAVRELNQELTFNGSLSKGDDSNNEEEEESTGIKKFTQNAKGKATSKFSTGKNIVSKVASIIADPQRGLVRPATEAKEAVDEFDSQNLKPSDSQYKYGEEVTEKKSSGTVFVTKKMKEDVGGIIPSRLDEDEDQKNKNKNKKGSIYTGKTRRIVRGDTGMYTGEWGNEGKLAILHEKQLVLNKDDTANILSAVDLVRTLSNFMNAITPNFQMPNLPSTTTENKTTLDQNVHITATFPNVKEHNEIEQALNNLINRASQYAFNTDR